VEFVKVRKKNQVTIPKKFALKMGLNDGDLLEVVIEDKRIVLTPVEFSRKDVDSG
jgi:AbrB family looped-hinge helix DNA binding protein